MALGRVGGLSGHPCTFHPWDLESSDGHPRLGDRDIHRAHESRRPCLASIRWFPPGRLYLAVFGASGQAVSVDRFLSRFRTIRRNSKDLGRGGGELLKGNSGVPPASVSANLCLRMIQLHLVLIYGSAGLVQVDGPGMVERNGDGDDRPHAGVPPIRSHMAIPIPERLWPSRRTLACSWRSRILSSYGFASSGRS